MMSRQPEICFAADRTLGRLAKWLRILGLDTIFESDATGRWYFKHLSECLGEGRIVLTRSGGLKKQCREHRLILIRSNYLNDQLRQVITETGIRSADVRPFSRCIQCNIAVTDIAKEEVQGRVPDYIFETHNKFRQCRQCNRIFWPGSHTGRTLECIENLFKKG